MKNNLGWIKFAFAALVIIFVLATKVVIKLDVEYAGLSQETADNILTWIDIITGLTPLP